MADTSFTSLRSPRLILRRLQSSDLDCFCSYRSRPEVARFQDWETFTRDDGERFLAQQSGLSPDMPGLWFQMGIELAATGALAGDCGLHCRPDDPRQAAVGITLAPEAQGKGYATEAIGCLLDYTFFKLHKHRVTGLVDADNGAAARLLERTGFRREGLFLENVWFKGKWGNECSFAVLRSEWEQRRHTEEVRKFQGVWKQVAYERDGMKEPRDAEQGWEPRTTFTGDTFIVTLADGRTAIKGTFKLDPTQEPKAVDYTDTFGEDAGKTFLAIYSLEGDRLIFCAAGAAGPELPVSPIGRLAEAGWDVAPSPGAGGLTHARRPHPCRAACPVPAGGYCNHQLRQAVPRGLPPGRPARAVAGPRPSPPGLHGPAARP
jgi:uncharacterized protein (TIGR03067 family)